MTHKRCTPILLSLAVLSGGCRNTPVVLENPVDPLAPNYAAPVPPFAAAAGILIDDFDDARIRNNLLSYCPETFVAPEGLAVLTVSQVSTDAFRGVGQSLRIVFDVAGAGDPSAGYVQPLTANDICLSADGEFNALALRIAFLSFWLRTSSSQVDLEVALRDIARVQTSPGVLTRDFAAPSTSWHKVRIPLRDLIQAPGRDVDLQRLREISFTFRQRRLQDEELELRGTVLLDEIAFER